VFSGVNSVLSGVYPHACAALASDDKVCITPFSGVNSVLSGVYPHACAAVASDDKVCITCSLVCIMHSVVCTPRHAMGV
jgi:hypothetical protein